jgi:hypothetical protein
MDIKKLNGEIEKLLEISDETKQSYLAKRQAQLDLAQKRMEKAQKSVAASNKRQVKMLPSGIDKETAENALNDLKYEMRKLYNGDDWRLEERDNHLILEVRYWGNWEGDDGSGDYDWQQLNSSDRQKLNDIITKVCKKHGVQINEQGSEKNWLVFEIAITKYNKNSRLDYSNEKLWQEFLRKNKGTDESKTMHKNRGQFVANFKMYNPKDYSIGDYRFYMMPEQDGLYTCKYKTTGSAPYTKLVVTEPTSFEDCLKVMQAIIDKREQRKNDPKRKRSQQQLFTELFSNPLEKGNNNWLWRDISNYLMEYYNCSYTYGGDKDSPHFKLKMKYGVYGAHTCYLIETKHKGSNPEVWYSVCDIGWPEDADRNSSNFYVEDIRAQECITFDTVQDMYDIKTWFPEVCKKLNKLIKDEAAERRNR